MGAKRPKGVSRISTKVYSWKAGAIQIRKLRLDPQQIGEEIERIRVSKGRHFDNAHVVEAARSPSSPLHRAFTWDDTEAAAAWRIEQAKYLVRSVDVRIVTPERKEIVTRAFVSTASESAPQEKRYTSTEYAMGDPELRAQVVRQALRELAAIKRKYVELSELADVFAAIDSTMKMVG